jgi:hypothetical protein
LPIPVSQVLGYELRPARRGAIACLSSQFQGWGRVCTWRPWRGKMCGGTNLGLHEVTCSIGWSAWETRDRTRGRLKPLVTVAPGTSSWALVASHTFHELLHIRNAQRPAAWRHPVRNRLASSRCFTSWSATASKHQLPRRAACTRIVELHRSTSRKSTPKHAVASRRHGPRTALRVRHGHGLDPLAPDLADVDARAAVYSGQVLGKLPRDGARSTS